MAGSSESGSTMTGVVGTGTMSNNTPIVTQTGSEIIGATGTIIPEVPPGTSTGNVGIPTKSIEAIAPPPEAAPSTTGTGA